MDKRQLKRAFLFSTEEHKRLIETLLLKVAEEENKTVSEIIEAAIIADLSQRFPDLYAVHRLQELQEDKETPQA